ncbi:MULTISPECIES: GNAT family N-acetyltransferase [Halorussus]|uniref:GNAT family N-acetyltransferase n=1 Tax=Halorussus TaxID=1070314 RepID=UPI00209DD17B|nr:GNAT family N-acetyltransferase [Halorussus vallis]USZ76594.1 GNAT family N-acetyltransferase [Halorussus vallis]
MVSVEPATSRDVDALADRWVELAEGQRSFGSHLLAAANRSQVRAALARSVVGDDLLVARDEESADSGASEPSGDAIVGFVMFTVESSYYDQDVTRGVVQNIHVDPDRRGGGVGTALLAAAERALADRGVDIVALEVMADNEAARRFYRRRGYRPHRIELEKPVESDTLTKG